MVCLRLDCFSSIRRARIPIAIEKGGRYAFKFRAPQPQQKPSLRETVKWAVWHEGCRIYAEDNSIGDIEQIRECVVGVYARNDEAQQLVNAASNNALLVAVRMAGREIPGAMRLRFSSAARMRRPVTTGDKARTTCSTSGSSGMLMFQL